MPKGVTKRRPRTRAALLQAALETFAEHGFRAATIEQVCARAGFTRGAFYSNFSSKEELFLALFDEHSERIVRRIAERMAALPAEELTVPGLVDALVDIEPAERDWYLVTTEFTLHAIRDPQAAWVLARHDARLRAELVRGLTAHLARIGRTLTVDAEELARLLVAVREGGLAQSYVEPDRLPPGRLERRFLPALLTAVTTAADPAAATAAAAAEPSGGAADDAAGAPPVTPK
ncbi:TetR/AcrR family transcriptional regulator [Kitasatospora sp. NPDC059571]|uniref:TetR/AcrR family transcriptional regulator n=1 Tax=Kitasatospora sp. NPDC059571 TaxID=3346871 RepID=UPI0036A623DD